jgi:gas vesicle protein
MNPRHPRGTRIVLANHKGSADSCRAEIEVFIMRSGRYESSENSKVGSAVTFLLIGLGAGALVALLFAPKAGKHFRRDLKRGYEGAKDTLQEWGEEARDRAQDAKEKVLDVAERGAGWAEELRETARKVEPLRRVIKRG